MPALPYQKAFMKLNRHVQRLLLSVTLATSMAAQAQVQFSIQVGPPEPIFELAPPLKAGYAWAPGYWAWNYDRHIWIRGRTIVQRVGYRWQPDRWEQRGNGFYRQPGNWERDPQFGPPRMPQEQRGQKLKKPRNHPQSRGPNPQHLDNPRR